MKEAYIADLKPGTSVSTTFLVRTKDRKTARNGSAYLDLEFRIHRDHQSKALGLRQR